MTTENLQGSIRGRILNVAFKCEWKRIITGKIGMSFSYSSLELAHLGCHGKSGKGFVGEVKYC